MASGNEYKTKNKMFIKNFYFPYNSIPLMGVKEMKKKKRMLYNMKD